MDRPHPLQYVTLALALLAAIFAFLAMQSANDARQAAEEARSEASFNDGSWEIRELQDALIRAGVIDDPSVMPIDQGDLDGPWGRCATAEDLEHLGLDGGAAPPSCDMVEVELVRDCPDPAPEVGEEGVEEACELWWVVDGQRYTGWEDVFPADVEREGEVWLRADPASGADRVTRTSASDGAIYLHVIDEGWLRFYAGD